MIKDWMERLVFYTYFIWFSDILFQFLDLLFDRKELGLIIIRYKLWLIIQLEQTFSMGLLIPEWNKTLLW